MRCVLLCLAALLRLLCCIVLRCALLCVGVSYCGVGVLRCVVLCRVVLCVCRVVLCFGVCCCRVV